eukprot:gene16225-17861_t
MSYQSVDGDFVHQAIEKIGFGKFQIIVIATLGLRIFAFGTAKIIDSILEPFLLCEMHLSFFKAIWIVTAKAIGQIFGSVIIGRISDLYGRRRTLLVFLILEVVAYSLNAISNGYTMIIITRTIIGILDPAFVMVTSYVMEILPATRRNVFSILKVFGVCGFLYCVGIAMRTLRHLNWRWFVVISNVLPLATCAFLVCFLPESPRFLFKSGQVKETVLVLTKIAEMNKYDAQDFAEFVEAFELDAKQSEKENTVNFDETDFSEPSCEELEEPKLSNITILKLFAVVAILEIASTFLSNFVNLAAVQFSRNPSKALKYKSCLAGLHLEYLAYISIAILLSTPLTFIMMGKLPRLTTFQIILSVIALNIIPLYWDFKGWQLIVILFCLKLSVPIFVFVSHLYSGEILPTSHRALGLGVGRAVANIGLLISTISVDYLYHLNKYIPFGDSIVKHIQTNKILSKNPEINVNKIIAYTWSQVEETVADQNLTLPDNIVIHTGTNDLRDGISADEIINSAKKTADIILSRNANAHLTFSAIIPRGDNELLDIERQDVNLKMLKWCHNQERIEFVDNTNLSVRGGINVKMYAQDKIHLNETGTKLPASNIGFSLKIQLQIAHLYQVPNRNPRGQGFRRRGSRNPQFDARGGHRGRSWSPAEYE